MPQFKMTNLELIGLRDAILLIDKGRAEDNLPKMGDVGRVCCNLAHNLRALNKSLKSYQEGKHAIAMEVKGAQDATNPQERDLVGPYQTAYVTKCKSLDDQMVEVDLRQVTLKELGWDKPDKSYPFAVASVLMGTVIQDEAPTP